MNYKINPGVTYGWIKSLDRTELFIFNALTTHREHINCRLVVKQTYCDRWCRNALYCADHDHFITWMKEEDGYTVDHTTERLEILGISTVIYPNDGSRERIINETSYSGGKIKTTTVKNFRTSKKTKIWTGYKGNPYRDPSMPEYWDFIESFL